MRQPVLPPHGGDIRSAQEAYSLGQVLDFSANINPLGMPEAARDALARCPEAALHYPDPQCRQLRAAIAQREGVPDHWILCGNGASDLIYRIAQGLRPRQAMVAAPTFGEYELALSRTGCTTHRLALYPEDGFRLRHDILQRIHGKQALFLCNPNNPCGNLIDRALLGEILRVCKREGCTLVVDECFLDFVSRPEEHTMREALASSPRLLILRAFTKIYAMPGLRLGYVLCSDRKLLNTLAEAGPPWSVSAPAQLCGVAALEDPGFVERSRDYVRQQRIHLAERLEMLGMRVFPGEANYLFFASDDLLLADKMAKRGILIRDCRNFHGLDGGYYRVAVRSRDENNRLLEGLRQVLYERG